MLYIISGFLFGLLIPYLARRIGKLIPASSGYILLKIFVPSHYMPWAKLKNNEAYMELFSTSSAEIAIPYSSFNSIRSSS